MTTAHPQGPFRRAVLTLLSGSAAALAVTYLAQPILVRLFTPEDFGLLDVFLAAVSLLIPVASLRYEDAVMLPEDEDDALNLCGLAWVLMAGVSVAVAGVVAIAGSRVFGADFLPWAFWLAPALVVLRTGKIMEMWLTRHRRFRVISQGQAIQALTMTGTRLAAGVQAMGVAGLIGGYLVGTLVGTGIWTVTALKQAGREAVRVVRPARMRALAGRYRDFAVYSTPSTMLNALITRLPFLLLLYYFDTAVVGYFGRAFAVLAVPLSLIGAAIAQVFFVEGADAMRAGRLGALTQDVHRRLVAIGLFPTAAVMIAGPELIAFVFGAPWTEAGIYLRYTAPWLFLASIASPLTRLFDLQERQRADLAVSIGMFVVQTAALVIAGRTGDVYTTLIAVGTAGAAARVAHLGVLARIAGLPLRSLWHDYAGWAGRALPFLAVVYLTRDLGPGWVPFAGAGVAAVGYALLVMAVEGRRPSSAAT